MPRSTPFCPPKGRIVRCAGLPTRSNGTAYLDVADGNMIVLNGADILFLLGALARVLRPAPIRITGRMVRPGCAVSARRWRQRDSSARPLVSRRSSCGRFALRTRRESCPARIRLLHDASRDWEASIARAHNAARGLGIVFNDQLAFGDVERISGLKRDASENVVRRSTASAPTAVCR